MLLTTSAAFVHPALMELKRSGPGPVGYPGQRAELEVKCFSRWMQGRWCSRPCARPPATHGRRPTFPKERSAGHQGASVGCLVGHRPYVCELSRCNDPPLAARPTRYLRACCTSWLHRPRPRPLHTLQGESHRLHPPVIKQSTCSPPPTRTSHQTSCLPTPLAT